MKSLLKVSILICFFRMYSQNIEVKYYENSLITNEQLNKIPEYLRFLHKKNTFSYDLKYSNATTIYQNDDFSKLGIKDQEFFKEEKIVEQDSMGNKTINTGNLVDYKSFLNTKEKTYYKNFVKDKMFCSIGGGEDIIQIVDKPFEWNWKVTDESKIISGYTCRKAISNLMGLYFEAWFTDEIPVNAGPDKYDGLPGLILFIKTPGIEIVAHSIIFIEEPIHIEEPVFKGKTVTFMEALGK